MARRSFFRTGAIETGRLEAFSDGVMAIVITLLVLEIKIPEDLKTEAEIWHALGHIAPVVIAWVVSFFFVLVFWISHHYFIASLRSADRGLLWLNGLFLLCISSTPFPTGIVGAYPDMTPPLVLLSASMCATSLVFATMRYYASFRAGLVKEHVSRDDLRRAMWLSVMAPALYLLAGIMAFVWHSGSFMLQAMVPLLFSLRSPVRHAPERDAD